MTRKNAEDATFPIPAPIMPSTFGERMTWARARMGYLRGRYLSDFELAELVGATVDEVRRWAASRSSRNRKVMGEVAQELRRQRLELTAP